MKRIFGVKNILLACTIACCSLALGGVAGAQTGISGSVDYANDGGGATTFSPWVNANLTVGGWAGAYGATAPVAQVQILIDGSSVGTATLGSARPDVAAAFPSQNWLNSGWTFTANISKFSAGQHTVTAIASYASAASPLNTPQVFTILAPKPPFGFMDVANNSTSIAQTASLTVSGWAVDPQDGAPVKQVQVLIDGKTVGNATTGLSRSDVATYYNNQSYLKSGWTFSYSLATLAGQHTVTFVAYDKEGLNASLGLNTSNTFNVLAPDLIEAAVVVSGNPVSGGTLAVTDTLTNQGPGAAANSYSQIFLSSNGTTKGTFLGYRYPAALAPGVTAAPVNTTVTLPGNISGNYFLMVCANGNNAIVEGNYANNCTASAPFTVAGLFANLMETNVSLGGAGSVLSGSTVQVTDSVANQGVVTANSSYSQIFLSSNGTIKSSFLGFRNPASLAVGSIDTKTTTVTLPANIAGNYFVMVCANGNNAVAESNYADNCASVPVTVYLAAATVVVDPAEVATPYIAASCGTATAGCRTIADGVTKATSGQTVLVAPGTYSEQITIAKNISLVSLVKNLAIIKAPPGTKLVADTDGQASLVTLSGGATSVTIKDMTVAGPMFSDSCADFIYGVYVKNANATISGNKIDAIQQADRSLWGCQQGVGIRFGSRALAYIGHAGTISGNVVTGPAKAGIVVDGTNTNVNVIGNTVTGLLTTGIIGQNGIQMSRGAKGTVDGNTISGFTYGTTISSLSAAGILVYDETGGVTITNNTVTGNDEGIGIYTDPAYDSSSNPTQVATTVVIKNNKVNGNVYLGIHIDPFSKGNTIWNNTANGNVGGWDELDEHSDFSSNNWATDPSNFNTVGNAHAGLVFSY